MPVALVIAKAGVSRAAATAALRKSRGHVRKAIELALPRDLRVLRG